MQIDNPNKDTNTEGTAPVTNQRNVIPTKPASEAEAFRKMRTGGYSDWQKTYSQGGVPNAVPSANKRSFWEDPQRVARYYNFIRTAAPGSKLPDWMDRNSITDAYNYLRERNNYAPWQDWKYLPSDDPGSTFLKGLKTPDSASLLPSEKDYADAGVLNDQQLAQKQPVDWNTLEPWQQVTLGLLAPQTPDITNRPKATNFTASLGAGAMAGLGYAAAAGLVSANPYVALAAGLIGGGISTYENYTGNSIPVIDDILAPFNWLSQGAERVIGVTEQAATGGIQNVIKNPGAAWQAAGATYDVGKADLINGIVGVNNALASIFPSIQTDTPAAADEVWKFNEGFTEPKKLSQTTSNPNAQKGAEALIAARDWISSGDASTEFSKMASTGEFTGSYTEYVQQKMVADYGITGSVNDMVLQTVIDPLNIVPFAGDLAGEKIASSLGNERLAAAFKEGRGNILIDALPPGFQQIAEKLTGKSGSKGAFQVARTYGDWVRYGFYPASMVDMPEDMRSKYNDIVKSGVNVKDISIEGAVISWKDADGGVKTFTGSRSSNFEIPTVENLTDFEKWVGGIDDTYGLKELEPTIKLNFAQKLKKLTPASQVAIILNIFHHNISALMDAAEGDPGKMVEFFQKAAGAKEIEAGSVGEAILKSPSMRAVDAAIKYAIKDGDIGGNLLANWAETETRRTILNKIASGLGETPGKILEQVQENPEVLASRLNKIAPELKTTPDALVEALKVFTGDDALPWNVEQFQATIVNTYASKMDKFFQEKYGLKPENWVFRMSNLLKSVQSLVLLDFNPGYLLNNWVNNVVTRAAVGVGGYMTPKQIEGFYERFGILPEGSFNLSDTAKDSGLNGYDEITGRIVRQAQETNDMITKATKVTQTLHKAGIFSRLAGTVERTEGAQARVAGIKQFMDRTKQVGVGIRKMAPGIEAMLDQTYPGMKERIYAAVNAGMNMKEIENSLYSQNVKPTIEEFIDVLDKKYTPDAPGTTRDLLTKTGVIDRLNDRLLSANTPEDIDMAFADVQNDFESFIQDQHYRDIVNKAEDIKNVVTAERIPAVLQLFGDQVIDSAQSWINGRKDWESAYARYQAGYYTDAQWHKECRYLDAHQQSEMRRMNEIQLQTYKGIIDALGIDSDFTRGYIDRLVQIQTGWDEFWKKRSQLFKEYFQRQAAKEPVSWDDLQNKLGEYYDKYTAQETKIQAEMDGLFANGYAEFTGWDATKAAKWRSDIRNIRESIITEQKAMRAKTRGMKPEERDAAYAEFNPIYNQLIVQMKKLEHDGAYELMSKPAPEKNINVPEVKQLEIFNPELPDESPDSLDLSGVLSKTTKSNLPLKEQAISWGLSEEQANQLRDDQLLEYVRANERSERLQKIVSTKINADDIERKAEKSASEAITHTSGRLSRRDVEEQWHKAFKTATDEEIAAVMTLMDVHADTVARRDGEIPSELTRDQWYSGHIAQIEDGQAGLDSISTEITQNPKGSVSFLEDGRAVIRALSAPDISTMAHEVGHIFRRDLSSADLDVVAKYAGLKNGNEFQILSDSYQSGILLPSNPNYARYQQAEEAFARGWERYLAEGDAPTPEMKGIFRKFTDWMMNIYQSLKKVGKKVSGFEGTAINANLDFQVNGVSLRNIFDRMLVDQPNRPVSYDNVVQEHAAALKDTGRNYRFTDKEIVTMAKKEILRQLFGQFANEEEAKTAVAGLRDYLTMPDGTKIDSSTAIDALNDISIHPEISPWSSSTIEYRGTKTSARSIEDPNRVYEMQYKVVDLDSLNTSDKWVGDKLLPNELYPQELQPRNRSENQSITQVDAIARTLVPEELLYDSKSLDRGAPIVGPDNNVESGNGRLLALRRSSENYPDNWKNYQDELKQILPIYGIDPSELEGMKKPVLVRERLSDVDRVAFAGEGNKPVALQMNTVEQAINDANLISNESLTGLDILDNESIDAALRAKRNSAFLTKFLDGLTKNERGKLSDNGEINASGIERIKNALFSKVYTGAAGERLSRAFTMSLDNGVKTAENAIMASLPQVARMEGLILSGFRNPDLSISNDISAAVDKLADIRANKMSLSDYFGQMQLFSDELTPVQRNLLQFIGEQRQPKKIREFIQNYARLVESEPDPHQQSMFGDNMGHSKEELLNAAIKQLEPESNQRDLFSAGATETGSSATQSIPVDQLEKPNAGGSGVRQEDNSAGIRTAVAQLNKSAQAQTDFNSGKSVPISDLDYVVRNHNETLPEPEIINQLKELTEPISSPERRAISQDYFQWIIDGEKGPKPDGGNLALAQSVYKSFEGVIDILRDYARDRSTGIPIDKNSSTLPGLSLKKTYKFLHGDTPCVANIYKDGNLIAYLPEMSVGRPSSNGEARILGLDPLNPNRWVYDVDGAINSVDEKSPKIDDGNNAPSLFQRTNKAQGDLFSNSAEDLPLFSGTAQVVQDEVFNPKTESPQMSLFSDVVPEAKPTRIIEIAVKENGATSYIRLDLKKTSAIRQTIALHKGENMTYRILDASGKVVSSGGNPMDVVNPKFGNALFQDAQPEIKKHNFKKWFGESKVVDDQGNPLVVYHQTSIENEKSILNNGFDISKIGARASDSEIPDGFFFKPNDNNIGVGAIDKDKISQMPVYLRIQNPLQVSDRSELLRIVKENKAISDAINESNRIDLEVANKFDDIENEWKRLPDKSEEKRRGYLDFEKKILDEGSKQFNESAAKSRKLITDYLREKGYDGLEILNDKGSFGRSTKTFIAFNPEQIKSVNNNGQFDISSRNILYQIDKGKSIDSMNLDELRYALSHDELTGIKNRRAYEDAKKLPYQVVIDVEGLKYVNDNLGHEVGDDVLRALAKSSSEVAPDQTYRGSDRADEFIMQFASEEEAKAAVAKVESTLAEQRIKFGDQEWQGFGMSAGIGKTLSEADKALNTNKNTAISEGRRANRGEKPVNLRPAETTNPDAPMGSVPLDGTPQTEPYARVLDEINSEKIRPMIQDLKQLYKEGLENSRDLKFGNLDREARGAVKDYLNTTVKSDLASTKLAALNYGDQMRNESLLDYSKRYGFDNVLGVVFPYQFWYTRSLLAWAKRMVDKPSWYSMYVRLKQAQDKMERDGMPTRLKGNVRISMPWMPDWMGGGLWVDPLGKLFPFDQFGQPLEQFASNKNQVEKRAETILDDMVESQKISLTDARSAKQSRDGSIWDQAVNQAELELDKSSNPVSIASMMMQPAMWWQLAANLATGQPEKTSVMPITKTGQTIRELGKDTFLEPVSSAIGTIMAGPEEKIRKAAGLSEFGQWGDYYIDRTIAGMAADGEISADDARIAMIQRSGDIYNTAVSRVRTEQAIKTPGAAGIMALKNGASGAQALIAAAANIFGGQLFTTGELKMRGLKAVYDNAWRQVEAGDTKAIEKFYDGHPEYSARLALYDDPSTRLHQFLVDSIWQKYMDLDPANRRIAANTLGTDFQNAFLNKETRSYDSVDDKTLAKWAQQLGSSLPKTSALDGMETGETPKYYDQGMIDSINAYKNERTEKFPNYAGWSALYNTLSTPLEKTLFLKRHPQLANYWTWSAQYKQSHPELSQYFSDMKAEYPTTNSGEGGNINYTKFSESTIVAIYQYKSLRDSLFPHYSQLQEMYYSLPIGYQRKAFLSSYPELKNYWTWKSSYADDHPDIKPYFDDNSANAGQTENDIVKQATSELSSPLVSQLLAYSTGEELSDGAKSEIERIRKEIAPKYSYEDFLDLLKKMVSQNIQ
jgi:GGDEF domain-containing protein